MTDDSRIVLLNHNGISLNSRTLELERTAIHHGITIQKTSTKLTTRYPTKHCETMTTIFKATTPNKSQGKGQLYFEMLLEMLQ